MSYPTPTVFVAFLDANPARYKNTPEVDGYNPTSDILAEITDRKPIPNPDAQGDVPKPLTITDIQALISNDSLGRLSDTWWDNLASYLGDRNPDGTGRAEAIAITINSESRGNITPDESTAIQDEINSTIPDPAWTATVPDDADCMKEWGLGGFSGAYVDDVLGRG